MIYLINQIRDFLLSDLELSKKMEMVHLKDGQVLFESGDSEAGFYLIKSGKVRIYQCNIHAQESLSKTLGEGKTLGELTLIDGQPHSVTAVSFGSSYLLCLNRHDFLNRVYHCPELNQLLIKLGNQRLRCLVDYIKKLETWINLLADSQCDVVIEDMEEFNVVQSNGLTKSGYLVEMLETVSHSFKDIVETVKQLKGNKCQLEVKINLELDKESLSEVKLNLELDEYQHQQEVEEIVRSEYFDYLVKLAEKRNTVSNTENSGKNQNNVLHYSE
ncbi:MAG: Crp/Fnr family transcriptional regulator [Crocosphaera sp.]